MNLAKSSAKILFARVGKSIISFTAVIIFSRKLGASPLGTYYPFLALLGILAIPADFGIIGATQKRISEGDERGSYLTTGISMTILLLFPISLAILAGRKYINQFLGAELTIPLLITLFASQAGKFTLNVLRGELRVGETAIIEVLRPLSWLIIGYALLTRGYGVHGLVYGYLIGSVLMLVVGWWKISISPSRPTMRHARSLFDYGRFGAISSIGGFIYSWMDVAILTLFVSLGSAVSRGDVGAYENAWRLSLVVGMFGKAVSTTLFPQFSRWDSEDAKDRIEAVIPTVILASMLITIPAFVGTVILAKDLLRILFGPEFVVAWITLIIFSAHKIIMSIHTIVNPSLNAINRPDIPAYAALGTTAINLVLNIVLIWGFGIVGAAWATMISFSVNTTIQTYALNQFLTITFPTKKIYWSLMASSVMGICVYFIHNKIPVENIFHLLVIIISGVLIYGILLLINRPMRKLVISISKSFM